VLSGQQLGHVVVRLVAIEQALMYVAGSSPSGRANTAGSVS
jgi:hypothetical protein